jgi:hypothetical protein
MVGFPGHGWKNADLAANEATKSAFLVEGG